MIECITRWRCVLLFREHEKPAGAVRSEDCEQMDFVAWIRENYPEHAALMTHAANEGKQAINYRGRLRKMGQLTGWPDLVFLKAGAHHHAALIEMKSRKHTAIASADQRKVLIAAAQDGKFAAVCNGFEAAKVAFKKYVDGA